VQCGLNISQFAVNCWITRSSLWCTFTCFICCCVEYSLHQQYCEYLCLATCGQVWFTPGRWQSACYKWLVTESSNVAWCRRHDWNVASSSDTSCGVWRCWLTLFFLSRHHFHHLHQELKCGGPFRALAAVE